MIMHCIAGVAPPAQWIYPYTAEHFMRNKYLLFINDNTIYWAFFFFCKGSRPGLGPTQRSVQWVQKAVSLGVERPGRESDHHHLLPSLIMRGAIPLLPHVLSWRVTLPLLVTVSVLTSTQAHFTVYCFSRKYNCVKKKPT